MQGEVGVATIGLQPWFAEKAADLELE